MGKEKPRTYKTGRRYPSGSSQLTNPVASENTPVLLSRPMSEPLLSIVVPAYNEGRRIRDTLEKLCYFKELESYSIELIVVDDGSTDQTIETVSEFPAIRLVRNDRNHGKGFTVRHGVLEARGEFILFTDADLSTPIEEVDKLLSALQSSGADAAVGSRALKRELIGIHQPWFRDMAGRFFNLLVRVFTGLRLCDTQCGFKLFKRSSTRRAFEMMRVEGFGFDPELLFLIERQGGRVVEVPVRWNDNPATKVRFLRDSARMFLDLMAIRWRAFMGKYQ
jgi:dolichyl-phosphate beta-glucosyltransferase